MAKSKNKHTATHEVDHSLYCPFCGASGMRKRHGDIAQSGKQRHRCQTCHKRTTTPRQEPFQELPTIRKGKGVRRFVVTSAQNDTPIQDKILKCYQSICAHTDAQFIVVTSRYQNPDSRHRGLQEQMQWPASIVPYVLDHDLWINDNLVIRGGSNIVATNINPLSGANHAGGTNSEIFAHPQVALELVPTPKDSIPKILMTTGTISEENYGSSFRAKKAEFHHSINAIMVEIVGDRFWIRYLPFDGSGVQDLNLYYTPDGQVHSSYIEGIVYGDLHVDQQTQKEWNLFKSLVDGAQASYNVLHDVLDMHTGSHHKEGDVITALRAPDCNIRGELDRTIAKLKLIPNAVIVDSNHDRHLDQWFNRSKPQQLHPDNLDLYFELAELLRQNKDNSKGLFQLYAEKSGLECQWTSPDKEFDIAGRDVSQHFDRGPNGSRGSVKAFARTGRKTVGGHSHTPGICKGSVQVGVHAMGPKYAKGYSSWMVSDCLIYPSGKVTPIFAIKEQYSPMVRNAITP